MFGLLGYERNEIGEPVQVEKGLHKSSKKVRILFPFIETKIFILCINIIYFFEFVFYIKGPISDLVTLKLCSSKDIICIHGWTVVFFLLFLFPLGIVLLVIDPLVDDPKTPHHFTFL